ncbi:MAG: hypothetical protein ACMUJM_02640 [bacterium]
MYFKNYIFIFIIFYIIIFLFCSSLTAQYTSFPFTSSYSTTTSSYPTYSTTYPTTNYAYTTPTTTAYPITSSYLSSYYPGSTYPTTSSYLSSYYPGNAYPTTSSYLSAYPTSNYLTGSNYLSTYPFSSYLTPSNYSYPFTTSYPLLSNYNSSLFSGYNYLGSGLPTFGMDPSFYSPFNLQNQLINTTTSLLSLLTTLTTTPSYPYVPASSLYNDPWFNLMYGIPSLGLPMGQQTVPSINPFTSYTPVNPYNPVTTANPFNPVVQQNLSGNWTGTWFNQDNGTVNSGTVTISFVQSGTQITSQTMVSFVSLDGSPKLQSNVTGTINEGTVNITGNMPSGSSVYTLTIIADISGNYMSGTYSVRDTTGQIKESGTISLSKS